MDKDVQERFERIERNLDHAGERMNEFAEGMKELRIAHQESEAAQKSTSMLLNRFIEESRERGREVDERIANLTILVDRLVAKDLGRNGGQ